MPNDRTTDPSALHAPVVTTAELDSATAEALEDLRRRTLPMDVPAPIKAASRDEKTQPISLAEIRLEENLAPPSPVDAAPDTEAEGQTQRLDLADARWDEREATELDMAPPWFLKDEVTDGEAVPVPVTGEETAPYGSDGAD